jgi:GH25 family lysozyme M1 (1,4-beta-N-acetylmuramidase)
LSYGAIDPNAKTSLENAKNAGLYHDAYHFPCIGKVSATDQVN